MTGEANDHWKVVRPSGGTGRSSHFGEGMTADDHIR